MSERTSAGGPGIAGLLGVAFIVLKLTHVINWSWWYVTLPLWGPLAAVVAILGIAVTVLLVKKAVTK